jgi:DNA-binding protein HU-beta
LISGNFPKRQEVAVNRSEIVDEVASKTGLEKRQAEAAVSAFLDVVMAESKAGNRVSIFGFGTFNPTSRAARTGRNPQTGAPVKIAASKGIRFAPAAAFKSSLNTKGAAKKSAAPAKKAGGKKAAAKAPAKKATSAKKTAKTAKKR